MSADKYPNIFSHQIEALILHLYMYHSSKFKVHVLDEVVVE